MDTNMSNDEQIYAVEQKHLQNQVLITVGNGTLRLGGSMVDGIGMLVISEGHEAVTCGSVDIPTLITGKCTDIYFECLNAEGAEVFAQAFSELAKMIREHNEKCS